MTIAGCDRVALGVQVVSSSEAHHLWRVWKTCSEENVESDVHRPRKGGVRQRISPSKASKEHAPATPMRQKRFFKDLSPVLLSPPDSGDGAISPLQGGSEGRHVSTLPSVFDNGRTESAAGDLDVEAGMDEASGRLPNTGGAYAGLPESEWSQMSRTERKRWRWRQKIKP